MATARKRNTTQPDILPNPDDVSDAAIWQHCEAILEARANLLYAPSGNPRRLSLNKYNEFCSFSVEKAEAALAIPAVSPAEMRAKARVLAEFAPTGVAMYSVRILAASLADDVLRLIEPRQTEVG